MSDDNPFTKMNKSRYDTQPTVKAPSPPPLDETFIDMLGRKLTQSATPLVQAADAAMRSAGNMATVGLPDWLESKFGAPGKGVTGVPQEEMTATNTRKARKDYPTASGAGDIGGGVLQAVPISRGLGLVSALGKPTVASQVANQALTGMTGNAVQQGYESVRDETPINPTRMAVGTVLGGILGGAGGAGASLLGRGTGPGIVARTIPSGVPTAERTALVKSIQRGENAGFNPDIAEAARASGRPDLVERVAPALERQLRKGGEAIAEGELPTHMRAFQAQREAPGGYFDRKGKATANLTKVEDDIAAATQANAAAEAANAAANVPGLPRTGPQPRVQGRFERSPQGPVRPEAPVSVPSADAARKEVERFKAFLDLEQAASKRPTLPAPPGPVRPASTTIGIPGVGTLTHRSGRPSVGPTLGEAEAAAMMQSQPTRAAGLLGRVPMPETAGGVLPAGLLTDPILGALTSVLGLEKKKPTSRTRRAD